MINLLKILKWFVIFQIILLMAAGIITGVLWSFEAIKLIENQLVENIVGLLLFGTYIFIFPIGPMFYGLYCQE